MLFEKHSFFLKVIYFILFYLISFYFVSFYFISFLSYCILFHHILFYFILFNVLKNKITLLHTTLKWVLRVKIYKNPITKV